MPPDRAAAQALMEAQEKALRLEVPPAFRAETMLMLAAIIAAGRRIEHDDASGEVAPVYRP